MDRNILLKDAPNSPSQEYRVVVPMRPATLPLKRQVWVPMTPEEIRRYTTIATNSGVGPSGSTMFPWSFGGGHYGDPIVVASLPNVYMEVVKRVGEQLYKLVNKVVVPGDPGHPPLYGWADIEQTVEEQFNLGWNGGARSIATIPYDGSVSFEILPGSKGVVVGLNDEDTTTHYMELKYAFGLMHGAVSVYEQGQEKYFVGTPNLAETTFKIGRNGRTVRYYVDDVPVYTSMIPSEGELFLDASLYMAGDGVRNPVLLFDGSGEVFSELTPLMVYGAAGNRAVQELHPLRVKTPDIHSIATSLRPLQVTGADSLRARGGGSLPRLRTLGYGTLSNTIPWGGAVTVLSPMTGLAYGAPVLSVVSLTVLAPIVSLGYDRPYASMGTYLPPLSVIADGLFGRHADVLLHRLIYDGATAGTAEMEQTFTERVEIQNTFLAQSIYSTVMRTVVNSGFSFSSVEIPIDGKYPSLLSEEQTWVVNLDSKANAMYSGFSFSGYAVLGTYAYGVLSDGVYVLEGDTDDGRPIQAYIDFGQHDFGSQHRKGVPHCYLGAHSSGALVLKVTANGQEYRYKMRKRGDSLQTQRFDLGKGLRSNYYRFELMNEEGQDFELDEIEFYSIVFARRI